MNAIQPPKIGLIVEITREFGRGLCRGVSELARESGTFNPFLIDAPKLKNPDQLREYDGFIARVMNDRIAQILANAKKPIVDVYYDKPRDGFAIVKTRHSRIGTLAAEHFIERVTHPVSLKFHKMEYPAPVTQNTGAGYSRMITSPVFM